MAPKRARYSAPYPCAPVPAPESWNLFRLLRRERPDVVYWRRNRAGLFAGALGARLSGSRFLFALSHDDDTRLLPRVVSGEAAHGPVRALARKVRRTFRSLTRGLDGAGQFLAHGFVAQHGEQARGLPPARTRVIRNSAFAGSAAFALPRPFVVWVANVKPRKRPERFVELARALADEPVDFLAVGALQDERYGWLADRARVPARFHFLGARTPAEVNGVIAAAQLLVLTCEPEGFPNVLLQAWSAGKPTLSLAYDPDGLIAAHGLGAVAADVPALAVAARALLRDDAERAAIGARARALVAEQFALARNVDALERFCRELLGREEEG